MLHELMKEPEELWIVLSFILFAAILWVKGRKSIIGALDAKIAAVKEEVEYAQNLRIEAERLFQDYERRHLEAVADAEHVIRTAEKQAAEMKKQAELDLAETISQREKNLDQRLTRMKESAMEEIRRYAADLAIEATAGIIHEKLDKKSRDALIDQAIQGLDKKAH